MTEITDTRIKDFKTDFQKKQEQMVKNCEGFRRHIEESFQKVRGDLAEQEGGIIQLK